MIDIEPVVRLMLLCDDVQSDPMAPNKINVFGLVSAIRSSEDPAFPLRHPELCVYLQLVGGRGTGDGWIVGLHADTNQIVFRSPAHSLSFEPDPLAVQGAVFRLLECPFPEPGLYSIEFWYNDKVIARQPLLVR
jgi:hypothetical protein